MDNPRAALPGWCSASGRLSRTGPLKRSARRLSDVGLGTSGIGAERSWEYRFNPCENRLTPRQNAQQIPDERELGTRPSFHHVSCRLRNHSLPPLDQDRDVRERVDGWTHQMTRNPMLWSAHHQAARGHARGGTWFRFPSKELRWGWKKHPQLPSGCKMAPAMPHVVLEAAVARASMLRPIPRGAVVRSHCPRRHTQNSDTAQNQQVAHTASSRDTQASSPFLFDRHQALLASST